MNVLRILGHEHGLIRQFLDSLHFFVKRLERGEQPPAEYLENMVSFARDFVDKYHHYKEEHQMFRLLAEKAGGEFDGPIDALRYQHERGREHINTIAESLVAYGNGEEQAVTTVLENTSAFCSLLRQHVNREDHVFYPMAKKQLTEAERGLLGEQFEEADKRMGEDFFEVSEEQVHKMAGLVKL